MAITETTPETTEITKPWIFHYDKPEAGEQKITVPLCRTDHGSMLIQVCNNGGENNLHAHPHTDGFWFVLKGALRFYTVDDRELGVAYENQGIMMPRGYPYWFEYVANDKHEDLELLRFYVNDLTEYEGAGRVNYEPIKAAQGDGARYADAINAFEK